MGIFDGLKKANAKLKKRAEKNKAKRAKLEADIKAGHEKIEAMRQNAKKGKTAIKAMVKPKVMEQTPTGMANCTKATPYIPPAHKSTKSKL